MNNVKTLIHQIKNYKKLKIQLKKYYNIVRIIANNKTTIEAKMSNNKIFTILFIFSFSFNPNNCIGKLNQLISLSESTMVVSLFKLCSITLELHYLQILYYFDLIHYYYFLRYYLLYYLFQHCIVRHHCIVIFDIIALLFLASLHYCYCIIALLFGIIALLFGIIALLFGIIALLFGIIALLLILTLFILLRISLFTTLI